MAVQKEEQIYTACILDTETGGLDPTTCAITQLSCQMIRLDTFEIIGQFDEYIKPYPKGNFNPNPAKKLRTKREIDKEEESYFEYNQRALDVTGLSFDFLKKNGKDIFDVADSFIAFISNSTLGKSKAYKPFIVGQNIPFDINMLYQFFIYTGKMKEFASLFQGDKDIYGNFRPTIIDTLPLSRIVFANDPEVTSHKLEVIAEKLKIDLVDAHSSMADVEATSGIFTILTNRMRNGLEGDSSGLIKQAEKTRKHFKI